MVNPRKQVTFYEELKATNKKKTSCDLMSHEYTSTLYPLLTESYQDLQIKPHQWI